MGIYTRMKDQHNEAHKSQQPVAEEPVDKEITNQHTEQEEQVCNQVPHEKDIMQIGEAKLLFYNDQRELYPYTVIFIPVCKERVIVVKNIIVTHLAYLALGGIVPCNAVVGVDTQAEDKSPYEQQYTRNMCFDELQQEKIFAQ